MGFYDKNIEELKKKNEKLYNYLLLHGDTIATSPLIEIWSEPTREDEEALIIKKQSKEYRLNSIYKPITEAKKWVNQYKFRNLNIVISMYGFGNGLFVRELLNAKSENDIVLIFEPCIDIFNYAMRNYDISDILSKKEVFIFVEGVNDIEFHNFLQATINISNVKNQITCIHPQYDKVFPETCIKFWKLIKENYNYQKIEINTEIFFGAKFIRNNLKNSKFIWNSLVLSDLEGLWDGIPAIIVAAGPSVEENIAALKNAKGKALIIAVDRVIDFLLDNDVVPDLIATIDPIKPVELFSKRDDLKIPMLCSFESNDDVLELHKGKKIICNSSGFISKLYNNVQHNAPRLSTGASVATFAFSACCSMGIKEMILVGQDLAYDGEFSHAGGILEDIGEIEDIMLEGVDGRPVRSRFDWSIFISWYNDAIRLKTDIKVYDTKSRGAKIQGTENKPLQDIINNRKYKNINADKIIENLDNTFSDADMIIVKEYFENAYKELDVLNGKIKEAIEIVKKQIYECKNNKEETYAFKNNFREITKINKYFAEHPLYLLMESYITGMAHNQISELYKFTDDIINDKINTYSKTEKIYKAMLDGVEFIEPLLKEAIKNL